MCDVIDVVVAIVIIAVLSAMYYGSKKIFDAF